MREPIAAHILGRRYVVAVILGIIILQVVTLLAACLLIQMADSHLLGGPLCQPVDWFIGVPLSILTGFLVGIPITTWSQQRQGTCTKCNYNLRGNISGRCPECSEPIAKANPASQAR